MTLVLAEKRLSGVGNDRQQCAFHLLTCRAHFGPPLPRVAQPHWLPGCGASGALKYGERARVRACGVLEVGSE
jgi:hypothetical protein